MRSSSRNFFHVAHLPTRLLFASRTRGADAWVLNTPTGFPLCISSVSSFSSLRSVLTMASKDSQLRAAFPVPPYTTRSSGRSATSGSRLFMSMRRAASCCHPLQEIVLPRGARTVGRCVPATELPGVSTPLSSTSVMTRRSPRKPAGGDCNRKCLDVGCEYAVGTKRGDERPHRVVRPDYAAAGLERRAKIDALRRTHQLDGENPLHIGHDPTRLPRGAHCHWDDVLPIAICWNRVHACGMRKHLALTCERRRCHLGHHESGMDSRVFAEKRRQALIEIRMNEPVNSSFRHRRDICHDDRQKIQRACNRQPVEVSTA